MDHRMDQELDHVTQQRKLSDIGDQEAIKCAWQMSLQSLIAWDVRDDS